MESEKMICVKTEESLEIKNLFAFLKNTFATIKITFYKEDSQDGTKGCIKIIATNNLQTTIIYIRLDACKFMEYTIEQQETTIEIELIDDELFHQFISDISNNSLIEIYIDKNDFMHFKSNNEIENTSLYHIKQITKSQKDPKKLPSETHFEFSVMMDPKYLSQILNEMSKISEFIEIGCSNDELTFIATNNNITHIKKYNKNNHDMETTIIAKNSVSQYTKKYIEKDIQIMITSTQQYQENVITQGIYKLEHLCTIKQFNTTTQNVNLYLKNDYPLFMCCDIGSLGKIMIGLTPE